MVVDDHHHHHPRHRSSSQVILIIIICSPSISGRIQLAAISWSAVALTDARGDLQTGAHEGTDRPLAGHLVTRHHFEDIYREGGRGGEGGYRSR